MESNFFATNSYFIDERAKLFYISNSYKIYNDTGSIVGSINQTLTTRQKIIRLFAKKSMLPFNLEIINVNNELVATISRGWTFFMSRAQIFDSKGNLSATIQQEFHFLSPTFKIFHPSEDLMAQITGNWRAWNFTIKNSYDIQIGSINKKWAGLTQELFTTADKYNVTIDPKYASDPIKLAILATAVTIDIVYRSDKNE